jgi:cell division protease FtsH
MVAHYGTPEALGPAYCEHHALSFLGQHLATDGVVSDATTQTIEAETRAFLIEAHQNGLRLIQGHRAVLERRVQSLLEHETIERAGLRELFGPTEAIREAIPAA